MTVPIIQRLNAVGGRLLELRDGLCRPPDAALEASQTLHGFAEEPVERLSAILGPILERMGSLPPAEELAPREDGDARTSPPWLPAPPTAPRSAAVRPGAASVGSVARRVSSRATSGAGQRAAPHGASSENGRTAGVAASLVGFEAPSVASEARQALRLPHARSALDAAGARAPVSSMLPERGGTSPGPASPSGWVKSTLPVARAPRSESSGTARPAAPVEARGEEARGMNPELGVPRPGQGTGGLRLTPGIGRLSSLLRANVAPSAVPESAPLAAAEPVRPAEQLAPAPGPGTDSPASVRPELSNVAPREAGEPRAPVGLGVIDTERLADALADHLELELLRVYGASGR